LFLHLRLIDFFFFSGGSWGPIFFFSPPLFFGWLAVVEFFYSGCHLEEDILGRFPAFVSRCEGVLSVEETDPFLLNLGYFLVAFFQVWLGVEGSHFPSSWS